MDFTIHSRQISKDPTVIPFDYKIEKGELNWIHLIALLCHNSTCIFRQLPFQMCNWEKNKSRWTWVHSIMWKAFWILSDFFCLDTESHDLSSSTVVCYKCGLHNFQELAYQFRRNIPRDQLPGEFKLPWGCLFQFLARKKNIIICLYFNL